VRFRRGVIDCRLSLGEHGGHDGVLGRRHRRLVEEHVRALQRPNGHAILLRRDFDLRAEGVNLIVNYIDQPGTLGKIGTLLGAADINIHAAQLSEDAEGPGATILLRIDRDVPADARDAITQAVGAKLLEVVDLS